MQMIRRAMIAIAASVLLGAAEPAPQPPASGLPFKLMDLGHGVYSAIDIEGRAGSNAGFIIGDDGVVVVDSFFAPDASKAMLAEIRKLTDKPIRYVINTHYHMDHVNGNATFKAAGAKIIAQRRVRAWIHDENPHLFGDRITPEIKTQIAAIAGPDILVDKHLRLKLGHRVIEIDYRQGHTGGDLTVLVPDARVIFCGDLVWNQIPPNLIDGTVATWVPTLQTIERLPHARETAFVPGHGEMAALADVAAFEWYLDSLLTSTKEAMGQGLTGDALLAAVNAKMAPRYATWPRFDRALKNEVKYMAAELDGSKQWPQPQPKAPVAKHHGRQRR